MRGTRRRFPLRRATLRTRLALWYGGAFALAGAVLVGVTYAVIATAITAAPLDTVHSVAAVDETDGLGIEMVTAGPTPGALDGWWIDGGRLPGTVFSVETSGGEPSAATTTMVAPTPTGPVAPPSADHQGAVVTYETLRRAVVEENERIRAEILRTALTWSVLALAAVGVLGVGVGWVIASRALRPLHRVTATARRVADDNLDERIALDGPDDEIKDLSDTFDAMLERLDRAFDGQRRFVANASHELRTPLTINRTVLEVALGDPEASDDLRAVGSALLSVNTRHERLIEGLLTLASADRNPPLTDAVDLADVVHLAVAQCAGVGAAVRDGDGDVRLWLDVDGAPLSGGADLRGDADIPDGALVPGDALLLERMVQNLVENAFRYNEPGGFVAVRLAREQADGPIELRVENSGPVVPPGDAEGLFEPFHRLDRRGRSSDRSGGYVRGGLGLGLSIVRSVAHAHGATATATARPEGGLVVTVRFASRAAVPNVPDVPDLPNAADVPDAASERARDEAYASVVSGARGPSACAGEDPTPGTPRLSRTVSPGEKIREESVNRLHGGPTVVSVERPKGHGEVHGSRRVRRTMPTA